MSCEGPFPLIAVFPYIMELVYSSLTQPTIDVHKTLLGEFSQHRIVIAFSGPPRSGKSTIADEVTQQINA